MTNTPERNPTDVQMGCLVCSRSMAFEPTSCALYQRGLCHLQGKVLVPGKVIDVKGRSDDDEEAA